MVRLLLERSEEEKNAQLASAFLAEAEAYSGPQVVEVVGVEEAKSLQELRDIVKKAAR